MGDVTFRAVDPDTDDVQAWMSTAWLALTLGAAPTPEWLDSRLPALRGQRLTAALDGDAVVGTYRSWDTTLEVPGGSVVADAVSSVGVLPTHRRRGLLSRLIRDDLLDAADRGVGVAVLIASEARIYPRYGFGPATASGTWTVDLRAAEVDPAAASDCTVRLGDGAEICRLGPELFRRSRRPGDIDRQEDHWEILTGRTQVPGHEGPAPTGIVARDAAGTPQGYLVYSTREQWDDRTINTTGRLHELHAATPGAYLALWRCVLGLDLVATLRAEDRAVDEVLPWLLLDPRAARLTSSCDFLWTRLLDPAAALGARRYPAGAGTAVVLEVLDPGGPAGGRYRLEVAEDGAARCERTAAAAQVRMPVQTLSALWLGGGTMQAAAAAGRAEEVRAGAVAEVGGLLHTPVAPWSSTWF